MAQSLIEYIIKVRSEDDLATLIPEFESWNVKVLHTYKRVFPGICVLMTGLLAEWYKNDARIESIEEAGVFQHFDVQTDAPPHLDRLDQRQLPLSNNFTFALDGTGVIAYILDSGGTFRGKNINSEPRGFEHVEYGGRLSPIPDLANIPDPTRAFDPFFDGLSDSAKKHNPRGFDGLGHGTHVAGIVGSETYGVAKNVSMRTSKIFGSSGSTTGGTIIAGIDAILLDHDNLGSPLAVCNMSFGGGISVSLETAVLSLVSAGIVCVVAAGNSGVNAETTSPARMPEVITVGAIDRNDNMANFSNFQDPEDIVAPQEFGFTNSTLSNFGSVVDIFAVGVQVLSTWKDSSTAVNTLTGTSMATPGVVGVVTLFIENSPGSTPAIIKTDVLSNATTGEITLTSAAITAGTPNVLAFSTFVDFIVDWVTPTGSLGSISEGQFKSFQLNANVFSGLDVIFTLLSGTLPTGVTLDGNTGIISGVMPLVSADEVFNFTIRAFDGSILSSIFADQNFSITVLDNNLPPLWATDRDLGEIEEGKDFQIQFAATSRNGILAGNLIYSSVGVLPHGWTITTAGLLEGRAPQDINTDLETGFVLSVDDGLASAEREFTIIIKQRFDFLPPTEPEWITPTGNISTAIEGEIFSFFLEAIDEDGVPQPVTYHLQINTDGSQFGPFGELPPGLSLNTTTGEISGTVSGIFANEDFQFAVFATDSANIVGRLFEITALAEPINLPPEWITPSGNVGAFDSLVNSSVQLQATDPDAGPQPLTYTVDAGDLPPGMSLDFNTGEIHGVPESVSQDSDFIFIVRVSDGFDSIPRTFTIIINRVNVGPEWITDSGLLISINEGQFLTLPLEAIDANNDELTFTLVSGSLPSTLVLREDGFITGPIGDINVDTTFSFTVEVDDSKSNPAGEEIVVAREFSIEVLDGALNPNQEPVWVTPAGALIQATENQQYFDQIEAIDPDGNPDPIIYFVSAGDFPQGFALNQNTGEISGIPIIDNNIIDDIFTFTVKAFDGLDFAERTFSIEVIDLGDDNIPPEWITLAGSLGSFDESAPLIFPLSAIDPDNDPITFSKTAGIFPPGLIMDDDGVISGTPAQVLSNTIFAFTIRVEDDKGKFADRSFSIQILDTVNVPPLWVTLSGSLGSVNESQLISFILSAIDPDTGPNSTLEFNVTSGTLPPGLSLNTSTGVINGTPDSVITDTIFNFDITVNDGAAFIPRSFSITILDITVFTGTTTDLNVPLLGELRNDWRRWNTDTLIDDDDIFQIGDPNFGRVAEPVIFVVRKLHTGNPDIVFNSFGLHHHTFKILITVPDFAVVIDSLDNIIYEVIYLKIIDPQAGSDFNITNIPTPSAFDTSGVEQYVSRNFFHLREELLTNIDNDDELPAWMTSEQIAGDIDSIIGYIPAIELAFVKPGKGQDILGRINEISTTVITLPSSQTIFDTILLSPTTIFDSDTTTFDKTAGTLTIVNKGIGFQFAGRQLIIDRYIFENSLSEQTYIKFNSDSPNPIWISVPGELGPFSDGSISSTNVVSESPIAANITYSIVYGNLPDGMVLNVATGEISGTILIPGFVSPTKFPFVIRATDALGNFTDRAFAITVTN